MHFANRPYRTTAADQNYYPEVRDIPREGDDVGLSGALRIDGLRRRRVRGR